MNLSERKRTFNRRRSTPILYAIATLLLHAGLVHAEPSKTRTDHPKIQCIPVEIYVRQQTPATTESATHIRDLVAKRPGTIVTILDLNDPQNAARFQQICKAFRVQRASLPLVYSCQQIVTDCGNPTAFRTRVEGMLRMTVYVRDGCRRCASGKQFLTTLTKTYPGIEIAYRPLELAGVPDELDRLTRRYKTAAASVPVFHLCNQLVVGFDRDATTGRRLDQILRTWTLECPKPLRRDGDTTSLWPATSPAIASASMFPMLLAMQADQPTAEDHSSPTSVPVSDSQTNTSKDDQRLPAADAPLPLPLAPLPGDLLPIPNSGLPLPAGDTAPIPSEDSIDLPVFGELSARAIGLPLFTIVVGLVDGFNPCAMWVLLFLLSVLVNLHDRRKIIAVAGTFVLISGMAYFAFMAAWLNVFLLVGMLRWVQVTLGCLAVGIGGIHIKDFFAFKRGLSLSIPESAKPGLYARVRRIVTAESLKGAIAGAAVLAVLVNIIELLCTAGLPALYTQILTMHELPAWQNYGYLLVYNLAYMFDDGVMVGLVVVTLGRRKMQEQHGRRLKLLSGVVIAALGLVMIFKPEWLG